MRRLIIVGLGLVLAPIGCSRQAEITIDGSSTVYLISEAVATEYKKQHPHIDISVGISGTGGGFKKLAAGETDISDASRKIKPAEAQRCHDNGIEFIEFKVAMDGLAVIINKDNIWARKMTVEQLRKIWHPNDHGFQNAKLWSDVDPSWPSESIELFGPGNDSGTFDYFTEAINGKEKLCRTDFQASEDDNIIIKGVINNPYAMGFVGVAYYEAHRDELEAVAVAEKVEGPYVLPSTQTVLDNSYRPLSRPLYIYVRTTSLEQPHIRDFVEFYLRCTDLVLQVGYVELPADVWYEQLTKLKNAIRTVE